jgi:serine/threonine protein kinase
MGEVYQAHDPQLKRLVAVKTIPPQNANAEAEARFLNEARRLSDVHHHNVVLIYEVAPEACPFCYFIMEHLEGGTLDQRLSRGPMSGPEVLKLGRELLAALGVAHRRGVIHRDVKPSNIFLHPDRGAVLGDFGIAKSTSADSTLSTKTGQIVGTEKYMPPEQRLGHAMPQSDFYALAIVLYESVTGEDWSAIGDRDGAHWSRVPLALRGPLRRALAANPEERWPDAAAFDRALSRGWWSPARRTASVIGAAVIASLIWLVSPHGPRVDLLLARPAVDGDLPNGLGDSIVRSLADRMTGFPYLTVGGPGGRWRSNVTVSSRVAATGPSLTIRLDLPHQQRIVVSTTAAGWRAVIDPLVDSLLMRLYNGAPLDSQLPRQVMPQSPAGMQAFLEAERAFTRAWWDSAYLLYARAVTLDSTCVLCRLRHAEVGRFLSLPEDTADESAYRAHVAGFTPQYQALIRAELVPLRARLDSLSQLTQRWPRFVSGRFRYADELIHRGPLIGHPRREAAAYFERTSDVRRDFVPAWEHLVWLWVAEGNAPVAKADFDTLNVLAPRGTTPVRDLLDAALAWRFLPRGQAAALTAAIFPAARARQEPLDAGARYLNAFDDQAGAIWLGAQLDSGNDHRESAMLAQLFGYLGLGRPQQAGVVEARLLDQFGDPAVELFGLELAATLMMIDPDSGLAAQWQPLAGRLREFASRAGMDLRPRAEWMAALVTQHFARQSSVLDRDVPAPLVALLNATETAGRADFTGALTRTAPLVEIESARVGDPFFRTILHFLRAEWSERLAQPYSADRELSWYENTDVIEYPTGAPQPSEVDWAFGVLARWRRAGIVTVSDDRCRLYGDVARLWEGGERRYAERADSARRAAAALQCTASRT